MQTHVLGVARATGSVPRSSTHLAPPLTVFLRTAAIAPSQALVTRAKVAERAERYEDMLNYVTQVRGDVRALRCSIATHPRCRQRARARSARRPHAATAIAET